MSDRPTSDMGALDPEPDRGPTCSSAVLADQGWCLTCGRRLTAAPAPPEAAVERETVTTTTSRGVGVGGRTVSPFGALAGLATFLLAMITGALLFGAAKDEPAQPARVSVAAPKAPVVNVTGGGVPAEATAASSESSGSSSSSADSKASGADDAASQSDPSADAQAPAPEPDAKVVDPKDVAKAAPGKDQQQRSAKLPSKLATGGKAPPKDSKDPGGGAGGGTAIG